MLKHPFVRIIIPVYNDWIRLFDCLEAIQLQTYNKRFYEVVVVDNGSDHIPELPDFDFSLEIRICSTKGSYAARNEGLKDHQADLLVFTDSDCIPSSDWLKNGVQALTNPNHDTHILAGRIEVFAANPAKPTNAELLDLAIAFPQKRYVEKRNFGVTANLFVKKEVFNTVGLFDNQLKSGGDTEFCQRGKLNGFNIEYSSLASVKHPARKTVQEIYSKVQRMVGGRLGRYESLMSKYLSVFRFLKPPARGFYYVYSATNLSLGKRARASLMLFVIWFASVSEWIRIVLLNKEEKRV